MPERIRRSRAKGSRKPEGAIVVTRGTKWGNPFRVGENRMVFADLGWGPATYREPGPVNDVEFVEVVRIETREQAVAMYRAWLVSVQASEHPLDFTTLRGHDLACWCPLDQTCHADVLLELANKESTP